MILSNGRATVSRIGRMAARKNNIVSQSMAAAATTTSRGFVSATQIVLEKHITKVPTMGDSITEVSSHIVSTARRLGDATWHFSMTTIRLIRNVFFVFFSR